VHGLVEGEVLREHLLPGLAADEVVELDVEF